jgi:hypothetical protein
MAILPPQKPAPTLEELDTRIREKLELESPHAPKHDSSEAVAAWREFSSIVESVRARLERLELASKLSTGVVHATTVACGRTKVVVQPLEAINIFLVEVVVCGRTPEESRELRKQLRIHSATIGCSCVDELGEFKYLPAVVLPQIPLTIDLENTLISPLSVAIVFRYLDVPRTDARNPFHRYEQGYRAGCGG